MKELSIKEKAKAYDGLIERLKDLQFAYRFSPLSDTIEENFPELKESENGRMLKQLRNFFKNHINSVYEEIDDNNDMLAWIENQGNFVKWYVCISQFCNFIKGRVYKAISNSRIIDDFGTEYDMHSDAYKYFRLWTIQDAKDGDVLTNDTGSVFIFRGIGNQRWGDVVDFYVAFVSPERKLIIQDNDEFIGTIKEVQNVFTPASNEQCDFLFQKLKEAGYEWNAEKKELKKLEDEPYQEMLDKAIELYYYTYGNGKGGFDNLSLEKFKDIVKTFVNDYSIQNYAWSDEDEKVS